MNKVKGFLNRVFIDGLSGMALGLFATLIIGTIIEQAGALIPGTVGSYIKFFGSVAKYMTGAGIGVGVASKFKAVPLVTVSAATAGRLIVIIMAHAKISEIIFFINNLLYLYVTYFSGYISQNIGILLLFNFVLL